jgi:hypothetical protein
VFVFQPAVAVRFVWIIVRLGQRVVMAAALATHRMLDTVVGQGVFVDITMLETIMVKGLNSTKINCAIRHGPK